MLNRTVISLLQICLVVTTCLAFTDPYPKNPKIDAINYKFQFELSDQTDEIKGVATVDIRFVEEGVTAVRLDLIKASVALEGKGMNVNKVTSEGRAVIYSHEEDAVTISLPSPSKKDQQTQFVITYSGIPATGLKIGPNKHGDRTFFSDNWPNKGRNWLPTIDHPYDKATCEFVVTAPDHYQVISNGLKIEETDLENGMRLTHWKQSVPIAPWLYVLGVAKFAVQRVDDFQGKEIQTWVYYQDRDAGFYDFAEPTKKVLQFYSDMIGPFSYEKLANIQSNSVGGGMEAASAILYGDNSVTGNRTVRWRNVVIHEIAHQWFGNAVTEYDWDDVWLSEGFATYFTLLFIEHEYGRNEFVRGLKSSKQRVDIFQKEHPEYRIVHDNLKDMKKVTTGQTYQKGSWVLHMLRGVVGTENFWKGIQAYYAKYKDLNASTSDFKREMEMASGMDLTTFFEQWLYRGGMLKYQGDWEYRKGAGEIRIRLNQVQEGDYLFQMPVQVGIKYPNQRILSIQTIQVNEKTNSFSIKVDRAPEDVILDPDTYVLMDADFKKK